MARKRRQPAVQSPQSGLYYLVCGTGWTMERDDGKEESRRILDRVAREAEAASPVARVVRRAQNHFNAADADQKDWIEIWGTRIGRALALIIVLVIIYGFILYVLRGG